MLAQAPDTTTRLSAGPSPRATPRLLLAYAAACFVALAILSALVFLVEPVHAVDRAALQGFQLGLSSAEPVTVHRVAHSAKALPVVILLCLGVAVAFARRRPERALAAVGLVVCAAAFTEAFKELLATQRTVVAGAGYSVNPASYPSGHATASMSLVLAAVLVAPRRLVPLAALV